MYAKGIHIVISSSNLTWVTPVLNSNFYENLADVLT